MLAQSFQSAADLGLTERQLAALQKTLVLLETGRLIHTPVGPGFAPQSNKFTGHFNMNWWGNQHSCGTISCIGGTAELIGKVKFRTGDISDELLELFEPNGIRLDDWGDITTAQAATALRSYLTIGAARWDLALTSPQSEHP